MELPSNYLFSKEHEWLEADRAEAKVGITEYAQSELGDVVFVQLPEVGIEVNKGESILTVESVKAVSDVYAPVDGKVVAVNEELNDSPQLINESPYEKGWMVVLAVADNSQLDDMMSTADYDAFVGQVAN
jgi:glycine cleavage system H protein